MIVLVVFMQLLVISTAGVRTTDGLHAAVRRQMARSTDVPHERSVYIMRIDDGLRCIACYPKQDAEHKQIRQCLPDSIQPRVVIVRLVSVRRERDFAAKIKGIPDQLATIIPDLNGELAAACRRQAGDSDLFVVYPDGSVERGPVVLEACGRRP